MNIKTENHNHYYKQNDLTEHIIGQYATLNHKMNSLIDENESLRKMYHDIQKDVQSLQRVVELLRSI